MRVLSINIIFIFYHKYQFIEHAEISRCQNRFWALLVVLYLPTWDYNQINDDKETEN